MNPVLTDAPIIVVGAPRSGTKMLRELLTKHPKIVGDQYEAERVWCFGQEDRNYKYISPEELTEENKAYIQQYFAKKVANCPGKYFVDKNAANTLRLDYVRVIFPECKIIHIIRDGRDVAASLRFRWQHPLNLKGVFKERIFPIKEIPYFINRQTKYHFEKWFGGKKRVKLFGTYFEGIEEMLMSHSLIEVCGVQWRKNLEMAFHCAEKYDHTQYMEVRYEDIVCDPVVVMKAILKYLDIDWAEGIEEKIACYVRRDNAGKWQRTLSEEDVSRLMPHILDMQNKLGYMSSSEA